MMKALITACMPLACLIATVWTASFALAAEPVDYARDIKPILMQRCYACHGALKQEADLRLDAGRMIIQGGDSGPAAVVGKSAESLLIQRITTDDNDLRMPPEGKPLTQNQVDLIKAWIDTGAKSPTDETLPTDPRKHWSFLAPVRPPVPKVQNLAWVRNPIDAFIAAEHEKRNLTQRPPAKRSVLLRRAFLDLIGLPPTPKEQRDFLANTSDDAYEKVVEHLLNSPHYGERWGRHWMDIWRYSDPHGLEGDEYRSGQRHIWRWRDWIIESLNSDKGYDRMIVEMLAGDELAPGDPDVLRATGLLGRNWFKHNSSRMLGAVEYVNEGMLALTIRCATCHDHKYDPVTQEEYYRFQAFFRPISVRYDHLPGQIDIVKTGLSRVYDKHLDAPTFITAQGASEADKKRPLTPAVPQALGTIEGKIEPIKLSLYQYYPTLRPWVVKQTLAAAKAKADAAKLAFEKARASSTKEVIALAEKKWSSAVAQWKSLSARAAADRAKYAGQGDAAKLAVPAAKAERQAALVKAQYDILQNEQELEAARKTLKANDAKTKQAVAALEKKLATARKTLNTARENLKKTDAVYSSFGPIYPQTSTGRRLALARWIANGNNPRTARVAVNHIWLRHFGSPLVPDVGDFGLRGKPPTHPQLLDWLSRELIENRWSMKHLHRLIVLSNTYRMKSSSGSANNPNLAIDSENRFLWRMNHRRMEAEVIRDSMLAAAGQLDKTVGGPPVASTLAQKSTRRSMYFRTSPNDKIEFLALFDMAAPSGCLRRSESIAPQQALGMTNGVTSQVQSRILARRLAEQIDLDGSPASESLFVNAAFQHILSRLPTDAERNRCLRFLQEHAKLLKDPKSLKEFPAGPKVDVPAAADPDQRARENLVHALFNHNDFITVR